MIDKILARLLPLTMALLLASCGRSHNYPRYEKTDPSTIKFKDSVESNTQTTDDLSQLKFTNAQGEEVALKDLIGKKNIVLVMTRGYAYSVCVYCSTQIARLINRYDEISAEDAEVIAVFPIRALDDKQRLDEFLKSTREKLDDSSSPVPFPVLLDVELKVVDQLGIRDLLSKPATYIIDKQGQVRFAYVGAGLSDRPSVDAIISQLRRLND